MPITILTTKTDILETFFKDTDFGIDQRSYLKDSLAKLCENEDFVSLSEKYENGTLVNEEFCQTCEDIANKTGVHEYTVSLVALVSLTAHLKKLYAKNSIPENIYIDTVCDLKYKAEEGVMVKGVCGVFCTPWLYKYFELGRFALGRLQCEIVPLGENYKDLTEDTPCLKVHIPRSGKPLTPESIDDSIARAKEFFGDKLQSPIPVICKSYLLYNEFQKVYKEGSNLKKFADRFELIRSEQDKTDDYPNLWRMFDMDYTGNVEDYPENSSLHKNVKEYIRKGGKTGEALGIFFS